MKRQSIERKATYRILIRIHTMKSAPGSHGMTLTAPRGTSPPPSHPRRTGCSVVAPPPLLPIGSKGKARVGKRLRADRQLGRSSNLQNFELFVHIYLNSNFELGKTVTRRETLLEPSHSKFL